MSNEKSQFAVAKSLLERGSVDQALVACLNHLKDFPTDIFALRLKAKLQGLNGNLEEAIESITEILVLTESPEPCDFFYRGRWHLKKGDISKACVDFQKVLELSTVYKDDYYTEATRLHLAYAYAMTGDKLKAEENLKHLSDDTVTSVNDSIVNIEYIRKLLDTQRK